MSLCACLGNMAIAAKQVTLWARVSTAEQSLSTQIDLLERYAAQHFPEILVTTISKKGSAYHPDSEANLLLINTITSLRDSELIVFDESRLSRNTEIAGKVISIAKENRVTIHVVGIQDPYVCNSRDTFSRLFNGVMAANDEADMMAARAKNYARARSLKRAREAPKPPVLSQGAKELLEIMIVGGSIDNFNHLLNRASPFGEDPQNKMGGPIYRLMNTDDSPVGAIESGITFSSLSMILALFNDWHVFQRGSKRFTKIELAKVIAYHFGKAALALVCDERMVQHFFPDVEIDEEPGQAVKRVRMA